MAGVYGRVGTGLLSYGLHATYRDGEFVGHVGGVFTGPTLKIAWDGTNLRGGWSPLLLGGELFGRVVPPRLTGELRGRLWGRYLLDFTYEAGEITGTIETPSRRRPASLQMTDAGRLAGQLFGTPCEAEVTGVHPLVATALLVCAFHALRQYRRHSFWPLSLFQDPLD